MRTGGTGQRGREGDPGEDCILVTAHHVHAFLCPLTGALHAGESRCCRTSFSPTKLNVLICLPAGELQGSSRGSVMSSRRDDSSDS